jgi:hypothetical protein
MDKQILKRIIAREIIIFVIVFGVSLYLFGIGFAIGFGEGGAFWQKVSLLIMIAASTMAGVYFLSIPIRFIIWAIRTLKEKQ